MVAIGEGETRTTPYACIVNGVGKNFRFLRAFLGLGIAGKGLQTRSVKLCVMFTNPVGVFLRIHEIKKRLFPVYHKPLG